MSNGDLQHGIGFKVVGYKLIDLYELTEHQHTYNSPGHSVEVVAECQHAEPFSAFGLRWQATIATRYSRSAEVQDTTVLHIAREILWDGMPPVTSTPPPGP